MKPVFANYESREEFSMSHLEANLVFDEPWSIEKLRQTIAQKVANFTQESLYTVDLYPVQKAKEEGGP